MRSESVVLGGGTVSPLVRLVSAVAAIMKRNPVAGRSLSVHPDQLTPHMARDLGLTDTMEKPSLSLGIIEQAPRF
mgnify:CR=1 FL=1